MTRDEAIVADYRAGETYRAIALKHGISTARVWTLCSGIAGRRRARVSLTAEKIAAIAADYQAGLKCRTIAETHRVSTATVSAIGKRDGGRKPGPAPAGLTDRDRGILSDYARGVPVSEVAHTHGVVVSTIYCIMRAAGVRPRTTRGRKAMIPEVTR